MVPSRNGVAKKRDRIRLLWADGVAARAQIKIGQAQQMIEDIWGSAEQIRKDAFQEKQQLLQKAILRLNAYNPQRTLERGYVMLYDRDRHVISQAKDLTVGEDVRMQFMDGEASAVITGKDI